MNAGEWRELETINFADMLLPSDAGAGDSPIVEFSDKMVRNSISKKVYFLGCARGNTGGSAPDYECSDTADRDAGFIVYDELTNTWAEMPASPPCAAPHSYDHAAINQDTGDYFYVESGQISGRTVWKWASGAWTELPYPSTTGGTVTGALEWFPDLSKLTYIDGGDGYPPKLWTLTPGDAAWSQVAITEPIGAYSCFSRYSPQHRCIYFGGGISTSYYAGNGAKTLCKLTATGAIVRCADPPAGVDLGVGGAGGRQCIDPRTGNLLFFGQHSGSPGNGRVYSFDGTSWAQHDFHPLGTTGNQLIAVFVENIAAGVVMAVNWNGSAGSKVYLYRH